MVNLILPFINFFKFVKILVFKFHIKKQQDNPCLSLYRKTYQKKLMYARRFEDQNIKYELNNSKKISKFNKGVIS